MRLSILAIPCFALAACGSAPEPLPEDAPSALGGADRILYANGSPTRRARSFDIAEARDGALLAAYVVNVPSRGHRLVVARSTDGGQRWTTLWQDLVYARIGSIAIATADDFTSTRWPHMVHVAAQLIHTNNRTLPDGSYQEVSEQESIALFSGPADQPWKQYGWANSILPNQPTNPFTDWQVALTVLPADNSKKDYAVGVVYAYPEGGPGERAIYLSVADDPSISFDDFQDPYGARRLAGVGGEILDAPGQYESPDIAADSLLVRGMVAFGDARSGVVSIGQLEGSRFDVPSLLHQTAPGQFEPSIATADGMTLFTTLGRRAAVRELTLWGEVFTGQGFSRLGVVTGVAMGRADLWTSASRTRIAVVAEVDRVGSTSYPAVFGYDGQVGRAGFQWTRVRADDGRFGLWHRPRLAATDETFRIAYPDADAMGLDGGANLRIDP